MDTTTNLTNYILDLQKRFEQFEKLISASSYHTTGVWFGGLLFPEAYMTASRQSIAQRNGWSLEELELKIERYNNQKIDEQSFLITGLRIEGGNWTSNDDIKPIGEKEQIGKSLPTMLMTWRKVENKTI